MDRWVSPSCNSLPDLSYHPSLSSFHTLPLCSLSPSSLLTPSALSLFLSLSLSSSDGTVFCGSKFPGRAYSTLVYRCATMIQLWFKIFYPRRVHVTENAAQLLQRQFRGHLGRTLYREKKRLQERAKGILFRILNRALAMCFQTWRDTAHQIRGCRLIMKRVIFGQLIDRFDKWRDITNESIEWRKHKLRCESTYLQMLVAVLGRGALAARLLLPCCTDCWSALTLSIQTQRHRLCGKDEKCQAPRVLFLVACQGSSGCATASLHAETEEFGHVPLLLRVAGNGESDKDGS